MIQNFFGSFAIPRKIYYVPEMPKTRSGKILRRILRIIIDKKIKNKKFGDLSTILNKNVVPTINNIVLNDEK